MRTGELRQSFFKYVFFSILSTLGVSVYILVDTYFIALNMGTDGLTALNLCLPVFNFINGFGLMLGMGGGSRFAMRYCRVERRETDEIFTNAFCAAAAVAGCFMLTGVCFSAQITRLLGADSHIFSLAHGYLKTVLLFSPILVMNQLLICFLRNDSAARLATAGVLGSSLANIILDYVFIFRFGWGMEGAALATCVSPLFSMAIMSAHFLTGWNAFRLRLTRPSKEILASVVSLGLHAFVTEIAGGIVIVVLNFVIYRLSGNTGIAAYGIVANLAIVFTAIFTGLSGGVQPLLCQYHGERNDDAVKYLLRLSVKTAIFLSTLAYIGVCLNREGLLAIFNDSGDRQLSETALSGMQLYFLFLPFMGVNSVFSVFFASDEKPVPSQLISLLRGILLVVPLACLFYAFRSMNGIWLTVPIAEMLTTAAAAAIYFYLTRLNVLSVYGYEPNRLKQTRRY